MSLKIYSSLFVMIPSLDTIAIVKNILSKTRKNWYRGKDFRGESSGYFVLDLGCMKDINELLVGNLKIKNFKLLLSDGKFGPWLEVLKGITNKTYTSSINLETFNFATTTARFIKFEIACRLASD